MNPRRVEKGYYSYWLRVDTPSFLFTICVIVKSRVWKERHNAERNRLHALVDENLMVGIFLKMKKGSLYVKKELFFAANYKT